ncbi:DUF1700 domain-containing protein [Paenibacillus sp. RRE4]|uniref:HAAS signaling domain-containing protein n=1 Tax=Paenibacillus sp. RRE4 TaxID=2962587 RepID=UPI002880CC93|nr:DUF1700 domain-containing protein [Paenibacillus sp. RRE4]MDT0124575.1 DUF1700 domain-containing protein [Paenibacillus sp. RRE4]
MNRQQFMQAMEVVLRPMDRLERAELLADYAHKFTLGLREGKSEEEIARELGHPEEIARKVLVERHDAKTYSDTSGRGRAPFDVPTFQEMRPPVNYNRATRNFFVGIGLIFLNLALMIPIGLSLWSVWLTIASLSLLALAPVAVAFDYLYLNHLETTEIFVAIGLFGIGILFALASKFVFIAFKNMTLRYVRWNVNVMKGDVSA